MNKIGTTLDNINQTELMESRGTMVPWAWPRLQSWRSSYQNQLVVASNPLFNVGELRSWDPTRTEFGIETWVSNIGGVRTPHHPEPYQPPTKPAHTCDRQR